jgi:hypothetical protein
LVEIAGGWWQSGSLGIPESSKIEKGSGGDLIDALTDDGDGWRWPNFEAATGRRRRRCSRLRAVTTLRVRRESEEEVREEQGSGRPFIG